MARVLVDTVTLFRREMLRYRRDRAYWVGQLAFPLAFVAFIGFGLDRVVTLPTGIDYVAHIASGALALVIASAGVGGGFTLIEDRQSGFLRTLLVAPVSRSSLVLGKIAARVVASLALALVMLGLLAPFTALRLPHPAVLVFAIAGLTTAFVALGIVLASALRSLESFRLLSAFATIPIYLLSGIFYPLAALPVVTRALASANPFTYGVDLLRYALLDVHEVPVGFSAAVLAVLMLVSALVAVAAVDRWTRD
ncbi:MAG: ABC transporter permease [Deltaproteobacteria bacterium]|nr:MAG: ABC transporter permease [Deltaproteobacteria bacterium]